MIRVTVVLALGLAATLALRRHSAALRHLVLAAAIACAALMPLVEAVAPAWQLPLLPAPSSRLAPALTLGDVPGRETSSTVTVGSGTGPGAWAILPTLRAVWLIGLGVGLLLLAAGIARLIAVASRARPMPDGRWTAEAAALSGRLKLTRTPTVLQTSHPTLLFTWGLRQPKVLLPRDAGTWSDERVRIVLGHELAHVRRGDWAVQLLADCVRSAYWFNPLIWVACRRLRLESEHACDDAVLRLGVAAPDYASQLLDLARLFRHSRRSFFPAPAMARPSDLERRVRVMLNERMDRSPVGRLSGWLVVLALVVLTVPIAGLSLSAARGDTPPVGVSPRLVNVVLPATAAVLGAPVTPVTAVPRAASPRRPSETGPQAGAAASFIVTVVDPLGRLVPNLPVVLTNTSTGLDTKGVTDQNGELTAFDLPAGGYQLTVSKPGFKTVKLGITFAEGQMARSRVTLQLGMLAETIIVSARAGVAAAAVGAAQPGVAAPTGTNAPQARYIGTVPTEDPCSQSAEGGCVTPPRKLVDAKPVYPSSAVAAGTSGTVVIQGRVRTDGSVGDMHPAADANPDFANAAMQAIRLWEFSPTRLNGVPMEVQIEVTVTFVAEKK
jgi:TonB family protein